MTVETLIREYHQLPEADRLRFLELIHPYDESTNTLSQDWIAEVVKRWDSYKTGKVDPIACR